MTFPHRAIYPFIILSTVKLLDSVKAGDITWTGLRSMTEHTLSIRVSEHDCFGSVTGNHRDHAKSSISNQGLFVPVIAAPCYCKARIIVSTPKDSNNFATEKHCYGTNWVRKWLPFPYKFPHKYDIYIYT